MEYDCKPMIHIIWKSLASIASFGIAIYEFLCLGLLLQYNIDSPLYPVTFSDKDRFLRDVFFNIFLIIDLSWPICYTIATFFKKTIVKNSFLIILAILSISRLITCYFCVSGFSAPVRSRFIDLNMHNLVISVTIILAVICLPVLLKRNNEAKTDLKNGK